MRRLLAAFLLISLTLMPWPSAVTAQSGLCPGLASPLIPYAFETITVSTAAIGFTVATMTAGGRSPVLVQVTLTGDDIRYRVDGTSPTGTVGHLIDLPTGVAAVSFFVCGGASIGRFLAIRVTNDASATATFFAAR